MGDPVMDNRFQVRLNVCKSGKCANLGVADAPDYVWPVFRLGYPALGCGKCGSLPPLFNEAECNDWFAQLFARHLGLTGQGCPRGCMARLIRYGANRSGSPRLQCTACGLAFTPLRVNLAAQARREQLFAALAAGRHHADITAYRVLNQAAVWCESQFSDAEHPVSRIATQVFTLPFQGVRRQQRLYVIVSADADSGRVVQISTNYSPWPVGDSLRYPSDSQALAEPRDVPLVERVRAAEQHFLARSQFDAIRYGSAALKRNDSGAMVRPVIALHGHFQRLKRRFGAVTDHYLAHECVLRGAAITAWAPEVKAGSTHLWFVVEEGESDAGALWHPGGSWRLGWWNNHWQLWENATARKMVARLTGNSQDYPPQRVTLQSCAAFIQWLERHPWRRISGQLNARVISQQLACLAWCYNYVSVSL